LFTGTDETHNMQQAGAFVTFQGEKGLHPQALQQAFEQFGTVKRVLVETRATTVVWEQRPVGPCTFPEVAVEIGTPMLLIMLMISASLTEY
jgi:hypothetical protein